MACLAPSLWLENDPEEERFKLSTLDYLSPIAWNSYALFFRVEDAEKARVLAVLKEGLERTLSQARHLVGTIEKDERGRHAFVRKRDSTVKFVVQYLDSAQDEFPSLAELEKAHFLSTALGDIHVLSNAPMTFGEKAEAHPDRSPMIASYKANFIPGGLIFNMHMHHWSNDIMGWASFTRQLAENCYALVHQTAFPTFDPKCLDRSRFTAPPITPAESQVSAPPRLGRHPDHRPTQGLLFHVPKSRAAALKKAAWPEDDDDGTWISTYDAVAALVWRVLSRVRAPLYQPDPASALIWAEAVNMTKRLTDPKLPARMQGNLFFVVASPTSAVPPLTVAEVASSGAVPVPLSKLARYVRQMTASATGEMLDGALQGLAPVRNKEALSIRIDSFPPMTLLLTDWRDADVCRADFGFGRPRAYRHLFDDLVRNLVIVYPPRPGRAGVDGGDEDDDDEGVELHVAFETELIPQLKADPEWSKYTEFRGVDVANPVDD